MTLTCQTYCIVFRLPGHWSDFISLVSVYRLYCTGSSLQPSHLSDFIALVSVYSRATGQTLFHGFNLQPYHWSDFITLVPVYSRTTGQTLLYWFQLAVLTLIKLYFMVSVCSPCLLYTSPSPRDHSLSRMPSSA